MKAGSKKILLTLLVFSCMAPLSGMTSEGDEGSVINDFGRPVVLETAREVAWAKLSLLGGERPLCDRVERISGRDGLPLCYLFYLENRGYIAVAAWTCLPPVIAYCLEGYGSFGSDLDLSVTPLVALLQTDIQLRLDNIQSMSSQRRDEHEAAWKVLLQGDLLYDTLTNFQQWPPRGSTSTGGWLETNWHQDAPYNNFCPYDEKGDARSVAGCPAVTMAQILNYHQDIRGIQFNDSDDYYHNYGGNRYTIDDDYEEFDFPSFPELNNYLVTLSDHYQDEVPLTDDDKAALVFGCGVAAKQVYSGEGSGTFGVNQAYAAYTRFGVTGIDLLTDKDPMLFGRLRMNIIDGLPVHLAVVLPDWNGGHNLVIDGYNTDDYYHLNFGWGGSGNGWYLLPEEIPYDLTVIEGVIVDILNPHEGSDIYCQGALTWSDVPPGDVVTGSFTIENSGDNGSVLDWEITEYPEWGTWTFSSLTGHNVTPQDDPVTVEVSLVAPEKRIRTSSGYIRVDNLDNMDDFFIIPIRLATASQGTNELGLFHHFILRFLDRFPLLRHVLLTPPFT